MIEAEVDFKQWEDELDPWKAWSAATADVIVASIRMSLFWFGVW